MMNRVFLVFFTVALAVFVLAPISAATWARQPFPGFLVEPTGVISDLNGAGWSGWEAGLRYPQRVTHLNGIAVIHPDDISTLLSEYQVGQKISIQTVLPNGVIYLALNVELIAFPDGDFFRLFWLPYIVGLAYVGIAAWVFRLRRGAVAGMPFIYFCIATAFILALLFDLYTTHFLSFLWSFCVGQLGGAFISLAIIFPTVWPPVNRRPRLRVLPYLLSFALAGWSILAIYNYRDPWEYINAWRASYLYAALGILLFLALMVWRLLPFHPALARQQARVILLGGLASFVPVGIWMASPLYGASIRFNPALFIPALVIFPISIGLAILRYRLWDMDVIVNRLLVYSSLTLLLGAVYLASVVVLELVFRSMSSQPSIASGLLSSVVVVALFNPFREYVQAAIDRRFYRHKYDATRTLTSFGESVRHEVDLERLSASLLKVTRQAMQPAHVSLCCVEGFLPGASCGLDPSDPLCAYLRGINDVVDVDSIKLDSPGLQSMRQRDVRLVIPLVSHNELLALVNLGPRLSGAAYSLDDRHLLNILAMQTAPAIHVAQLARKREVEALERQRIEHELGLARLVQQTQLPDHMPQISGWDFAGYYKPAREVGGDFYDFIDFEDGRVGIVVGDVTDKGMPSALVMAETRSLIRAVSMHTDSPGRVLEIVNNQLDPDIPEKMFVTCLFAVLEPDAGRLVLANAGHYLPCKFSDGVVTELRATGMPLGIMPEMIYEEKEATVEPGEALLFYSDGLTEAHNPIREMFSTGRLLSILQDRPERSEALLDYLLQQLANFTGSAWEQEDDITMLTILHAAPAPGQTDTIVDRQGE